MKFNTGDWVIVTRRRLDGPDIEMVGKIVDASRDHATADCRGARFTLCEDTQLIVSFRRMQPSDWRRRRR